MKGCLKSILVVILFLLLVAVVGGIYALFWANSHLYVDQPMELQTPELDPGQRARLLKLFPARNLFTASGSPKTVELKLNQQETNWAANYMLSRNATPAKVSLKLGEDRLSLKYSRKSGLKYLNVMMDAGLAVEKENVRVNVERIQVGDYLVPTSFLGELNYLAELYLESGIRLSGDGTVMLDELKINDNSLLLSLRK